MHVLAALGSLVAVTSLSTHELLLITPSPCPRSSLKRLQLEVRGRLRNSAPRISLGWENVGKEVGFKPHALLCVCTRAHTCVRKVLTVRDAQAACAACAACVVCAVCARSVRDARDVHDVM